MDADRFDTLTRSLATAGSRRRALALAFSGALGPLLAREDAAAHDLSAKCKKKSGKAKKKCRKKAKKHNATHLVQPPPCVPSCGSHTCGPNGCGGECGTCDLCETCQDGSCVDAPNGTWCAGQICITWCQSGTCEFVPPQTALCDGGYCQDRSCRRCGANGQPCCPEWVPGEACGAGLGCMSDGLCHPCGDDGQLCCPGETCNTGLECRPNGRCEPLCGELGQRCCSGLIVEGCDSGLTCETTNFTCVSCGGSGDPCCPGGFCDGGLECCDSECRFGFDCF